MYLILFSFENLRLMCVLRVSTSIQTIHSIQNLFGQWCYSRIRKKCCAI